MSESERFVISIANIIHVTKDSGDYLSKSLTMKPGGNIKMRCSSQSSDFRDVRNNKGMNCCMRSCVQDMTHVT